MAINFHALAGEITASSVTIKTAGTGVEVVCLSFIVTNTDSSSHDLTVTYSDASASITVDLVSALPIAANRSVNIASSRIVLEEGDSLSVVCDTASVLEFVLSVMERS